MKRSLLLSLCAASLAGCFYTENPVEGGLSSFDVTTGAVLTPLSGTSTKPADVVGACAARYGGVQSSVPGAVRGTKDCPYAMPSGDVLIVTSVKALDETGTLLNKLNKNISFRVVPGDLTGSDYSGRTTQLTNGIAAGVRVRAAHLYGQVRVWAEDAPPAADLLERVDHREPADRDPRRAHLRDRPLRRDLLRGADPRLGPVSPTATTAAPRRW